MSLKSKFIVGIIISLGIFYFFIIFIYGIIFPKRYNDAVYRSGYRDGNFIYSVIKAESGFNENALSGRGAVGLMQIMPDTAEYVKELYDLPSGNLNEADYNLLIGINYIKYLESKFKNMECVIAAYNAGEGRVKSWLKEKNFSDDGITLKKVPFAETYEYIKRVKKFYNFIIFL